MVILAFDRSEGLIPDPKYGIYGSPGLTICGNGGGFRRGGEECSGGPRFEINKNGRINQLIYRDDYYR